MSLKNTIFILFFSIISFYSLRGSDSPNYKIEHLSIEHGLSQNTVRSILQDSKGFLWFATEDGLNRYDGYRLKVYRHNQLDHNSLSDNFIWVIFESKNGEIWIGTNSGGLNKFERETEKFIRYQYNSKNRFSISNNNIRSITEDKSGNLWIGTEGGGLNKFDTKHKKFNRIKGNKLTNIFSLFSSKSQLFIGTDSGLVVYTYSSGSQSSYTNSPSFLNNSNNVITALFQDSRNNLWVGTQAGLYNLKSNSFVKFSIDSKDDPKVTNIFVSSIQEDKEGNLLVGSYGGLIILKKKGPLIVLSHNSSDNNSLSNNNITSVIEDKTGIIWAGTTEGGINKINKRANKFNYYKHDPSDHNSLSYSTIRSIYQDSDGILWIGTMEGGLNRLDRVKNTYKHYKNNPHLPSSLSNDTVTSIFRTKRGDLCVGTWGGGLEKAEFDQSRELKGFKHFKNIPGSANTISSNIVQAIHEDSKGRLWIGTGIGLDLFNYSNNSFIHFRYNPNDPFSISDNWIQSNCIYEDREGNLWVGTWNGLNKIIFREDKNSSIVHTAEIKFEKYFNIPNNPNSLSNNRILSIYQDKKGVLWIGTYGGGLNKVTFIKNRINVKRYTEKEGLANDIIYGILGDEEDNLWLSTNNGLSKFNTELEIFQTYYTGEGLQSNQFYWGACFNGLGGELFFGGINGLNSFFPPKIEYNNNIPSVYFTDFQIFNKSVSLNDINSPLKKSIEFTKEIVLNYDKNVLTFEFVALDYFNPRENKYKYKMEPFDKDWVSSGRRNFATYTNLDPGEYTFRVIGSNNDEIWNKEGISLRLIINPPFWQTWWFILISFMVLSGTVFTLIKMHINDLLAVERVRIKLAADLHDNIGASLTEISILSEIIIKRIDSKDSEVSKSLKMISSTSRELIDKMSDIVWLVNPKRDSLYDLILRLEDTYSEILSCTNISFRSQNLQALEKVSLSMEHRQNLFLIFKEAINNAITHSSCTEILLNANARGRILEMFLIDNGKGFTSSGNSQGNGLGNMRNRAKTIGGKLDIISLPDKGTTVKFTGLIS